MFKFRIQIWKPRLCAKREIYPDEAHRAEVQ